MKAQDYNNVPIIDILFEGKNKHYGAYKLRKEYPINLCYATICTVVIGIVIWILLVLFGGDNSTVIKDMPLVKKIDLSKNYRKPKVVVFSSKKIDEQHSKIKSRSKKLPKKLEHLAATKKVIQIEDDIKKSSSSFKMDMDDSSLRLADEKTDDGVNEATDFQESQDLIKEKKATPKNIKSNLDEASVSIQKLPEYTAGREAWLSFLKTQINVNRLVQNGAFPGPYMVTIAFTVKPDSTISNLTVIRDPGYGAGNEVINVIKHSAKWIPGKKKGKVVPFVLIQDVYFDIK